MLWIMTATLKILIMLSMSELKGFFAVVYKKCEFDKI